MEHPEAGRVTYTNRRSSFGRFTLGQGTYVIVPSTFDPNQERQFFLRFFSERNAHAMYVHYLIHAHAHVCPKYLLLF